MASNNKNIAKRIACIQSHKYAEDIGMFKTFDTHYAPPVCAYIAASHAFLPFRTVLVGERPYSTRIHPVISSAMSYDPSKSGPTPSTIGLARDVSCNTDVPYTEAEAWARDSWMYANSGVLVVNCTVFKSFSSSDSLSEVLPFQRWLRCMLDCSIACGAEKIDVVCMGVPATNVVDSVIRSMGKLRSHISKRPYPNPAIVSKAPVGDGSSRLATFGHPGTSRSISKAILISRDRVPLTPQDYVDVIQRDMTSHIAQVDVLIRASDSLVDAVEKAYDDMKTDDKLPELRECKRQFADALLMYRDMVIRDVVAHTVKASSDSNASKTGRPVEWGSKKGWSKGATSTGTSTKMSVASEDGGGIEQKFADEDDVPQMPDIPERSVTPKPKKKVKKVIKKVARKRAPVSDNSRLDSVATHKEDSAVKDMCTSMGAAIDDSQEPVLRTMQYYVSDAYPEKGDALLSAIKDTIEGRTVASDHVGTLLDTASRDMSTDGVTAQVSLGIEDGEVSETALLPKVIEKVVNVTAR